MSGDSRDASSSSRRKRTSDGFSKRHIRPAFFFVVRQDTSNIDALSALDLLPLDLNLEPCCEAGSMPELLRS